MTDLDDAHGPLLAAEIAIGKGDVHTAQEALQKCQRIVHEVQGGGQ